MGRLVSWWMVGLCMLGSIGPTSAAGQSDATDRTRIWLGLGPVFGGARDLYVDVGGSVQLTAERGPHRLSLRLLAMGDAVTSTNDAVLDLAILYGRTASASFGYAAVAAGPAAVEVSGCSAVGNDECRTVGLTAIAEAGLRSSVVGITLQAFGNVNSAASWAGLGVNLLVGRMR